jgi:hypothetical protein
MPEADRQQLAEVLQDIYYLLEDVGVTRNEWVTPELREAFATAWLDTGGSFSATAQWLQGEDADAPLQIVGLTGVQLEVKVRGYWLARQEFERRRIPRLLRKLFRWMNVLLGSLAAAFPPAEPIKELKEALEADLEDAD